MRAFYSLILRKKIYLLVKMWKLFLDDEITSYIAYCYE